MAANQYASYQQPAPYDQQALYRQSHPYAQVQAIQHPYHGQIGPIQPWLNGQPPAAPPIVGPTPAPAPVQYAQYSQNSAAGPFASQRSSPVSPYFSHYQQPHPPTPTSPVRRPLPDPHLSRRPDIARSGTPQAPPPPPSPSPARFISHQSSVSVPSASAFVRTASPERQQQRSALPQSPPRPLPNPIPRSAGQLDLTSPRSESPTRRMLPGPPVSKDTNRSTGVGENNTSSILPLPAGQKFVPLWKRSLPEPNHAAVSSFSTENAPSPQMQGILERRGLISPGSSQVVPDFQISVRANDVNNPAMTRLQRSNSGVRPLPSPVAHARGSSTNASEILQANGRAPPRTPFVLRERSRTLPSPSTAPTYPPPSPLFFGEHATSAPAPVSEEPEGNSDDDDLASNALLTRRDHYSSNGQTGTSRNMPLARSPSPQYGIRDLPRLSNRIGNDAVTTKSERSGVRSSSPAQSVAPLTQSVAMQMAALSLGSQSTTTRSYDARSQSESNNAPAARSAESSISPAVAQSSVQARIKQWPVELPALPKAPGSGFSKPASRPLPVRAQSYQQKTQSPQKPILSPINSNNIGQMSRAQRLASIDLDDAPPPSLRRSPAPSPSPNSNTVSPTTRAPIVSPTVSSPSKSIPVSPASDFSLSMFPAPPTGHGHTRTEAPGSSRIPQIFFPDDGVDRNPGPIISISGPDSKTEVPVISVDLADESSNDGSSGLPKFSFGDADEDSAPRVPRRDISTLPKIRKGAGLTCGGCGGAIIGRIVSAMGARWHPGCFRCCVCDELLQNLSSYEHDGRPFCHLDYHENFAPRCFHCETAIVDEQFITLDDPELGKRTYHEQHFFCAECGDPFLPPRVPGDTVNRSFAGDGTFRGDDDDDVGFTVYKGHPYCEPCHVRLRMPKCKKCKKSIRDGMRAVEALGGKWCWDCFTCAACEQPFEDPSFFQRNDKPYCERCFSIMIKSEIML